MLTALAYASAALWILAALLVRRGARAFTPLRDAELQGAPSRAWPRVSIVVASRDEGEHVTAAISSLLSLDYPDYEIVAINDRSRDSTGEKLDELARSSDRIRVVHLTELPAGWIGKSHALHRGVEASTGEWILFTDGDVRFHPSVLRLAVARALDRRIDLLTLWPQLDTRSFWMRAFYSTMLVISVLALGLWAHTRRRQSLVAVGAGAFLLVRRSAYMGSGGHEAIRLRVVDDITLAQRVRACGFRTELEMGIDWLVVPWGTSLANYFHVTRKNGFAVFQFSWFLLLGFTVTAIAVNIVPPLLFLFDWRLWPASALVWLALADAYRSQTPLSGRTWLHFLLHPILVVILILPAWLSAIAVTREGGVRWRDSFYPLAELKAAL